MRKAAVQIACVAASAIIIPTFGGQAAPPLSHQTPKPPAGVVAGHRALRQLSLKVPPVEYEFVRVLMSGAQVQTSMGLPALPAAPPMAPFGAAAPSQRVRSRTTRPPAPPSNTAASSSAAASPTAAPSPTAALSRTAGASRTAAPGGKTHVVSAGDTLWAISRQYGVSAERLAEVNGLRLTSTLRVNRELVVPPDDSGDAPGAARRAAAREPIAQPMQHTVSAGESLWGIARRYDVPIADLMAANELGDSELIKPGQRLVIPGRSLPRHREVATRSRSRRSGPVMADAGAISAAGAFLWPARGILTSRFGWRYRRHHNGIDIASPRGTPIYAARDGVVEFAGRKGGYGLVVYLKHDDGFTTLYGHVSSLVARAGDRVRKGQLIAYVGCTGACTGSHLHFEVHTGGRPVNPMPYLR